MRQIIVTNLAGIAGNMDTQMEHSEMFLKTTLQMDLAPQEMHSILDRPEAIVISIQIHKLCIDLFVLNNFMILLAFEKVIIDVDVKSLMKTFLCNHHIVKLYVNMYEIEREVTTEHPSI